MVFLCILIFLFIPYASLVIYYWQSWKAIPVYTGEDAVQDLRISVIIPARNEEENLPALLNALDRQTYPEDLFEVIVIDDHSTDRTAEIVRLSDRARLLQLNENGINSYKKKAIETGVAAATGELIVTTDADCQPPPDWLTTIASFRKKTNAVFIAAPVCFQTDRSALQVFQSLDFMVLQGITGAAVFRKHLSMSNGANLAYDRSVFYEAGGFTGIDHIASGDDMLLMHKIALKYPDRVRYLKSKDAIVSTLPMKTWKSFFNQRIRWASKATQYNDRRILPVLSLVYLFNLSIPMVFLAGFWQFDCFLYSLILIFLKTAAELPLFISLAVFFQRRGVIRLFPLFQPLHIAYTIISGLLGQLGTYEWKGRKIR